MQQKLFLAILFLQLTVFCSVFKCANLANGKVMKLVGFEPECKYHSYYEAGVLPTMLLEN